MMEDRYGGCNNSSSSGANSSVYNHDEEEFHLSIKNNLRKIKDVRDLFKNLNETEKSVLEFEKKRSEILALIKKNFANTNQLNNKLSNLNGLNGLNGSNVRSKPVYEFSPSKKNLINSSTAATSKTSSSNSSNEASNLAAKPPLQHSKRQPNLPAVNIKTRSSSNHSNIVNLATNPSSNQTPLMNRKSMPNSMNNLNELSPSMMYRRLHANYTSHDFLNKQVNKNKPLDESNKRLINLNFNNRRISSFELKDLLIKSTNAKLNKSESMTLLNNNTNTKPTTADLISKPSYNLKIEDINNTNNNGATKLKQMSINTSSNNQVNTSSIINKLLRLQTSHSNQQLNLNLMKTTQQNEINNRNVKKRLPNANQSNKQQPATSNTSPTTTTSIIENFTNIEYLNYIVKEQLQATKELQMRINQSNKYLIDKLNRLQLQVPSTSTPNTSTEKLAANSSNNNSNNLVGNCNRNANGNANKPARFMHDEVVIVL